MMQPMFMYALASVLLQPRYTNGFIVQTATAATSRMSSFLLHDVPAPYYAPSGGTSGDSFDSGRLTSRTSNLKPGRNYAPTKPGVKHMGSREGGYLGSLQQGSGGFSPASPFSGYTPVAAAPSVPSMYPTEPPRTPFQNDMSSPEQAVSTTMMAPDGAGGRSASLLYNSRSDAFNYLDAPGGKVPATGASVESRNASYRPPPSTMASYTMTTNQEKMERGPFQEPMVTSNYMEATRRTKPSSYAPTKSNVKYKSSSSGTGYLDGLQPQQVHRQTPLQPPQQTQQQQQQQPPQQVQYSRPGSVPDPFAQTKMAAHAVSRLLHADPRTGESVNPDPFAKSRYAAEAVSLLLLKNNDVRDGVFFLT
jgi:hypothetical protein